MKTDRLGRLARDLGMSSQDLRAHLRAERDRLVRESVKRPMAPRVRP